MSHFALTFDDGPGPITGDLLDLLLRYKVQATFFVLGDNIESADWCKNDASNAKKLVSRALKEGHRIGNHSYSHPKIAKMEVFVSEITRCDDLIESARKAAGTSPYLIPCRLPFGLQPIAGGDQRMAALTSLGRTHTSWTKLFKDYEMKTESQGAELSRQMIEHVEDLTSRSPQMRAVLALHDSASREEGQTNGYSRVATLKAVSLFLEKAKEKNWKHFVVPLL